MVTWRLRDLDSISMVIWSRYRVILCFQPNYLFRSFYKAIAYFTIRRCLTYPRINLQSRSWRWLRGEASPFLEATGLFGAQWCNEDGNGLRLRSTSWKPWTYSKNIRARNTTRWTQWDWFSVNETSASNLLTTIVPKSKNKDLVEVSIRWYKRSAPLRHPDKWSTRLWEKLTDGGCTHPSSTRYSDEMRFGTDTLHLDNDTMTRDGPTTISETFPQQLKASIACGWSDVTATRCAFAPRPHRNNSRPRWFNGLRTIW